MKFLLAAVFLACSVYCLASDKDKDKKQQEDDVGPTATLNFVVLKDANGKPIRSASVVMHAVDDKGRQEKGDLELKTDLEGKASYEGVPYGKMRIQVLARGFQTFGADYEIDKPSIDISIRLRRPEGQYSVYEDHPDADKDQKQPPDPNAKPQ
jgi:hypothetical protein